MREGKRTTNVMAVSVIRSEDRLPICFFCYRGKAFPAHPHATITADIKSLLRIHHGDTLDIICCCICAIRVSCGLVILPSLEGPHNALPDQYD